MKCPNCQKIMDGISMAGNETKMIIEEYCNYCHTYLRYEYNPEVTNKILNINKVIYDDLPF